MSFLLKKITNFHPENLLSVLNHVSQSANVENSLHQLIKGREETECFIKQNKIRLNFSIYFDQYQKPVFRYPEINPVKLASNER